MVEQVAVHEAPVALRMLLRQAPVLVQVDGADLGEVQLALLITLYQLRYVPTGLQPVARPRTQLGLRMTCAAMILAAARLSAE